MVSVSQEFEGVIAAVGIAKQNAGFGKQDGDSFYKSDLAAADISASMASMKMEQLRLMQDSVRKMNETVPDILHKLKITGMQVDEVRGDMANMRQLNIQMSDFSNDLHAAFETFRLE